MTQIVQGFVFNVKKGFLQRNVVMLCIEMLKPQSVSK